ncbi:MAG: UDP-glucose--hexose-1-phosphate uridylyltransferase [Candidatus Latescibacterota bacterium]|jgi:UDPglucose--hexose-1-phosphate uridylyltransferase
MQVSFDPEDHPHRRYNPLSGHWVLVSPHRTRRPWQGKQESPAASRRPAYDPRCYLCPGNERAGGARNPAYAETFVFENDFAALLPDGPTGSRTDHPLLRAEAMQGECRVVCFSPRHDLTLAEMSPVEGQRVVEVWCQQVDELERRYPWIQIFENKGEIMGCSNPHPHGQIWGGSVVPEEVAREDAHQRQYYQTHDRLLLVEYAALELERGERVVATGADWLAVVPYWAVWPFEVLLLPRSPVRRLPELSTAQRQDLAELLRQLLVRYDNLFETSFPYSMGWHGAPANGEPDEHWQVHAHFYPPLLRSATVKKFMVGYEMMAEPQRDLTAEQAAARLRQVPAEHYRTQRA